MICYAIPLLLCYAMLCYAMLCYAMLCYVMLCYAMLCCAMLCYAMLCYAMLCYAMPCYAMLCRKGIETCYACPPLGLTAVCMACARRCQRERLLVPRIRCGGGGAIAIAIDIDIDIDITITITITITASIATSAATAAVLSYFNLLKCPCPIILTLPQLPPHTTHHNNIRPRKSTDACDCRTSGRCRCAYSHVRDHFDRLTAPTSGHKDECLGEDWR
jgi:hypothetical protein